MSVYPAPSTNKALTKVQEAQTPPIVSFIAGGVAGGVEAAATVGLHDPGTSEVVFINSAYSIPSNLQRPVFNFAMNPAPVLPGTRFSSYTGCLKARVLARFTRDAPH